MIHFYTYQSSSFSQESKRFNILPVVLPGSELLQGSEISLPWHGHILRCKADSRSFIHLNEPLYPFQGCNEHLGWNWLSIAMHHVLIHTFTHTIQLLESTTDQFLGGGRKLNNPETTYIGKTSSEIQTDNSPCSGLKPRARSQQHYLLHNFDMLVTDNLRGSIVLGFIKEFRVLKCFKINVFVCLLPLMYPSGIENLPLFTGCKKLMLIGSILY